MIDKKTYSDENIQRIVATYKVDYELAQRAVFALGLVEALVRSGLQFTFKGGSSAMLLFPSPKRLSTDVDILVDPGTDVEKAIKDASAIFPFLSYEESVRKTSKSISKKHFKIKYQSPRTGYPVSVIVDVLFAENHYPKRVELPLKNDFLLDGGGEPVKVRVPCPECLLGDKLTAFAPHTIGINFFNEDFSNDKRLEVIKQFFDVSSLYDASSDFALVRETYLATAEDEIAYRGIKASAEDCLDDSFRAALSILTWGKFEPQDYPNYVQGFKSIAGHIVGMKLNPNNAYLPAAKVMLLAAAIKKNVNPFALTIRKQSIFNALPYSPVNKVAKVAPEAFDLAATAIRLYGVGDPYESFPVFESQHFLLRAVQDEDIDDLLAVYSDPKSQPFFNSDNCHGDDFHYETLERMRQAMDFWDYSYKNRFFIRWAIVDKRSKSAIGTIEAFARHAGDAYDDCCLLRLDLRSDFENKEAIEEILSLTHPLFLPLFGVSSIATKAIPSASERIMAIKALGFVESAEPLIGDDGTEYRHYFQIK